MIVISEGAGIVRRVAEYVDFFADSSCGLCPFCKIGSRRLSDLLRKIDTSRATHRTLDHLVNLCQALPGSGRGGLVNGPMTVVESSLYQFPAEYQAHLFL